MDIWCEGNWIDLPCFQGVTGDILSAIQRNVSISRKYAMARKTARVAKTNQDVGTVRNVRDQIYRVLFLKPLFCTLSSVILEPDR